MSVRRLAFERLVGGASIILTAYDIAHVSEHDWVDSRWFVKRFSVADKRWYDALNYMREHGVPFEERDDVRESGVTARQVRIPMQSKLLLSDQLDWIAPFRRGQQPEEYLSGKAHRKYNRQHRKLKARCWGERVARAKSNLTRIRQASYGARFALAY
ncbi:MAG: hypothetical protein KC492_29845 [Myxococcales bacterium]|nr:hypothetical protein [Myxococcales bacterium]